MKSLIKDVSKKTSGKFAQVLFFFLIAAATAIVSQAQSINDDLQPKKTIVKPPTSSPTKKTTVVKPKSKKTYVKTTVSRPTTKQIKPTTPALPAQTPEQIIERFMNFQQSSSVTYAEWQSVVSQTTTTLQSNPNDAKAKAQHFVAKGQLAYNGNDFSNALVHFNAAAQVLPNSALPHYGIGKVYLITKQPNEAESAFEKAIKLDKDFALAYKGLGDVMTARRKTKKAQEYYKQAAKIGLAGSNLKTSDSQPTPNASGDNQFSVQNNPTQNTASQESFYDLELKAARQMSAQKKWQNSLDKLQALAKTNPTTDVYISIGDNYYAMEQWLSARQAYQKAAEINPNSAVAFYKTGMVLYELNEYQAAVEAFEKSLILDQNGTSINRQMVRKMADKANEKAEDLKDDGKKKKFLGIGF